MAEWEVQERAVNKTGEVNTLLIITNKQTNIRKEAGVSQENKTFLAFIQRHYSVRILKRVIECKRGRMDEGVET